MKTIVKLKAGEKPTREQLDRIEQAAKCLLFLIKTALYIRQNSYLIFSLAIDSKYIHQALLNLTLTSHF